MGVIVFVLLVVVVFVLVLLVLIVVGVIVFILLVVVVVVFVLLVLVVVGVIVFILLVVVVLFVLVFFLVAVVVVLIMIVVGHRGGERGQLDAGILDCFRQPEHALGVLLDHALPRRFQGGAVHDHQVRAGHGANITDGELDRMHVGARGGEHAYLGQVARDLPRPIADHDIGDDDRERFLVLSLGLRLGLRLRLRLRLVIRGRRLLLLVVRGCLLLRLIICDRLLLLLLVVRDRLLGRVIASAGGGEHRGARERGDRELEESGHGEEPSRHPIWIRPGATPSEPRLRALWHGRASRLWTARRRVR